MQLPTGNDGVNTVQLLLGLCQIVQAIGHAFNCTWCTGAVVSVVRLRSFGSLVLWILLRSPLDLLYRWNSHVDKQSAMGKLVYA